MMLDNLPTLPETFFDENISCPESSLLLNISFILASRRSFPAFTSVFFHEDQPNLPADSVLHPF
jgi:hypothetical protein